MTQTVSDLDKERDNLLYYTLFYTLFCVNSTKINDIYIQTPLTLIKGGLCVIMLSYNVL